MEEVLMYKYISINVSGPHEEEESTHDGQNQVRGKVQERQKQVVLSKAEILDSMPSAGILCVRSSRKDYLNHLLFQIFPG